MFASLLNITIYILRSPTVISNTYQWSVASNRQSYHFSGSFQINFNLEKNIEADIFFCIVSYSDGVLRHLNLYGVLELPVRKNAIIAYFKLQLFENA